MGRESILQSEAAECGLACLAMVAAAHGHRETLSELRRRFPISLGGSSLKDLMAIADTLGLSAARFGANSVSSGSSLPLPSSIGASTIMWCCVASRAATLG